ncbi:MAG TPA: 50S ribosomal protein L23 [Deltaproteobacteria bacterium]|nr:MAG: 50S ribosomal protein L23 [Deltaproteobacteria bacterium GWA2_55_82]OGQ65178.1 MAG: 50S ribosomal protein L23 [Deltaproteobacteria bacterium RIFCSPLOWO2_02_FULL_55_12]OIJ74696.1 MAG: 50S ribosomal protein L23 [Deltaproteobacteria bacterium GWC2_55_46]HBG45617.1 50S ribosomal protein L23 [Deltaproteobacteria bacterium]HCY12190.1 50S ribosomal protein L23 [Deltaproteobacteria bacterium]
MKNHYSILKSPVITEKSTAATAEGKVVFWVELTATKKDIKDAVENIFKVKVLDVNTQRVPGKMKRMGKFQGQKPTRKKAYLKLREGDKIEIFEGV